MRKVPLKEFKQEMRDYFENVVGNEGGKSFTLWFLKLMTSLQSEGKVVREGNQTFVLE
jgi:hypothetical protein